MFLEFHISWNLNWIDDLVDTLPDFRYWFNIIADLYKVQGELL